MRAVIFAYHNVGDRCLRVLCARGVEVALVVAPHDQANETIWFASVADTARELDLPLLLCDDPRQDFLLEQVQQAKPDLIFSFYYRAMLPAAILALAAQGAFNMHGSLLPLYRGRAPVNWAILQGATETGATLHVMTEKPDAGAIVDQTSVPILPDDTAQQVFDKVTVAAEQTLWRVLPAILQGQTPLRANPLAPGNYFSGRRPEDGRIDWRLSAEQVYNLIRAVAPPYPGAFTDINTTDLNATDLDLEAHEKNKEGAPCSIQSSSKISSHGNTQRNIKRCIIARARRLLAPSSALLAQLPDQHLGLIPFDRQIYARCGDGGILQILELRCAEKIIDANKLAALLAE